MKAACIIILGDLDENGVFCLRPAVFCEMKEKDKNYAYCFRLFRLPRIR